MIKKLLLWLVLVALAVALLLGGTVGALYWMTDESVLPDEPVTFGGAVLEPAGSDWHAPVLGGVLYKDFGSPANLTVQNLGEFTDDMPQLALPEWATDAQITITAPDGSVWQADRETADTYVYAQNGQYQLEIKASQTSKAPPAQPLGWYLYRARYTMQIPPQVSLSVERATQGSVVALSLTGILDGEPAAETDLGSVWFRAVNGGYQGYIPVTYNAESGPHTIEMRCGSLTETVELTVTQAQRNTVEHTNSEETADAANEYRNVIWPLYTASEPGKLWSGPFAAPTAAGASIEYGSILMEQGTRVGHATGLYYTPEAGSAVTAPQNGKIVFAGGLQLTGGTVVIDHGCGVKSYLYGLDAGSITVQQGQTVTRGDMVGAWQPGHELIYELRIGSKSVDPALAIAGTGGLQYRENF